MLRRRTERDHRQPRHGLVAPLRHHPWQQIGNPIRGLPGVPLPTRGVTGIDDPATELTDGADGAIRAAGQIRGVVCRVKGPDREANNPFIVARAFAGQRNGCRKMERIAIDHIPSRGAA